MDCCKVYLDQYVWFLEILGDYWKLWLSRVNALYSCPVYFHIFSKMLFWAVTSYTNGFLSSGSKLAGLHTIQLTNGIINFIFKLSKNDFNNNFIEIWFTYHIIHLFKMYESMVLSIFTEVCNHNRNFRTNSSFQKETLCSWAVIFQPAPSVLLLHPSCRQPLIYFLLLLILLFWTFYVNRLK